MFDAHDDDDKARQAARNCGHIPAQGQKGGGKGGGSGGGISEQPNTLRSSSVLRVIDLISEGEIVGLVDGPHSMLYNETPFGNADGTFNFNGVSWTLMTGLPDQAALPNFPDVEAETNVSLKILKTTPITRTITDPDVDQVRVTIQIPALAQTQSNGNVVGQSVSYRLEVRYEGGAWVNPYGTDLTISGKCTSPYYKAHTFDLPKNPSGAQGPWDVKLTRLTDDVSVNPQISAMIQNDLYWASYTELTATKFSYPNSAYIGVVIQAENFGTQVPTRGYIIKGRIISVPDNYDPETRAYTGIWSGTFKQAWTNNPAWVLYDLLTHKRYGLGEFIDQTKVDKWSLYEIAQYCDELVPDGMGGMEPRMTFNAVLGSQKEAYDALGEICSAFRGMAYWSTGAVMASQDRPGDPVMLVNESNVIGGAFSYKGAALTARKTAALVRWMDPQDNYQQAYEVVVDQEGVRRYGYRETQIDATGCTSRGQAHRFGKWTLFADLYETQVVTYQAGLDHAHVRPGDIVAIQDPNIAEVEYGGRLKDSSTTTHLYLDHPVQFVAGENWTVSVMLPDGTLETRGIAVPAYGVDVTDFSVSGAFSQAPTQNGTWIVQSNNVEPQQFKIVSVAEKETGIFEIQAVQHEPSKFAFVDEDAKFDPLPVTRGKVIEPPVNLTVIEQQYFQNGSAKQRLTLSWTAPGPPTAPVGYLVQVYTPDATMIDLGRFQGQSCDLLDISPGDYTFYVASVDISGVASKPASVKFTAKGWENTPGPTISNLRIKDNGGRTTFNVKSPTIVWDIVWPVDMVPYDVTCKLFVLDPDNDGILRAETGKATSYTYQYDDNAVDHGGVAKRHLKFAVCCLRPDGTEGEFADLLIYNPPPTATGISITSMLSNIYVSYSCTDPDYVGGSVWVSPTTGFDPANTSPVYTGVNNFLVLPEADGTYFVIVAAYDTFGTDELNYSSEYTVLVDSALGFDVTPPAVPTGLALSSAITTAGDGTISATLTATWDNNTEDRFSYFDVQIQQGDGTSANWLSNYADTGKYQWTVVPNTQYAVRVRSVSKNGIQSGWDTPVLSTSAQKTTPPGAPSALNCAASLKSAFLTWTLPADKDVSSCEVWQNSSNTTAGATKVGVSGGAALTISGLTTGTTYWFFVKAVNTSGLASGFSTGVSVTPGQVANGDIAANAITADNITAGTITGDKFNINTSLPATITIGATGVQIGGLTDPAALINAGTTAIGAGKILLAGSTYLSSWRNGTDLTKIEGGSIAANTVAANLLQIGSRNLQVTQIEFAFDKNTAILSWTTGSITYTKDNGTLATVTIAAGSVQWTTGTLYVAWQKDATTLSTATTPFSDANYVTMATYAGSNILVVNYGRTVIDGAKIITGTITTDKIGAGQITANNIGASEIKATHIGAGEVDATKLNGGTFNAATAINIGGTNFQLSAQSQNMVVHNSGVDVVTIGQTSPGVYGMVIKDTSGNVILSSTGVPYSAVTDKPTLGTLASQNTVNATQISGTIQRYQVTGFGALADVASITQANASTYIASAAIVDAMIGSIATNKIIVPGTGETAFAVINGVTYIADAKIKRGVVTQAGYGQASGSGGFSAATPMTLRGGSTVMVIANFQPGGASGGNNASVAPGDYCTLSYAGPTSGQITSGNIAYVGTSSQGSSGGDPTTSYSYSPMFLGLMGTFTTPYDGTWSFYANTSGSISAITILTIEYNK